MAINRLRKRRRSELFLGILLKIILLLFVMCELCSFCDGLFFNSKYKKLKFRKYRNRNPNFVANNNKNNSSPSWNELAHLNKDIVESNFETSEEIRRKTMHPGLENLLEQYYSTNDHNERLVKNRWSSSTMKRRNYVELNDDNQWRKVPFVYNTQMPNSQTSNRILSRMNPTPASSINRGMLRNPMERYRSEAAVEYPSTTEFKPRMKIEDSVEYSYNSKPIKVRRIQKTANSRNKKIQFSSGKKYQNVGNDDEEEDDMYVSIRSIAKLLDKMRNEKKKIEHQNAVNVNPERIPPVHLKSPRTPKHHKLATTLSIATSNTDPEDSPLKPPHKILIARPPLQNRPRVVKKNPFFWRYKKKRRNKHKFHKRKHKKNISPIFSHKNLRKAYHSFWLTRWVVCWKGFWCK